MSSTCPPNTPNAPSRPPIAKRIPPLALGTATFNCQYNSSPESLSTFSIVQHALHSGLLSFDTSPYYGPAETLLGSALTHPTTLTHFPRPSYFLTTKVGRINSTTFDYTPAWVRQSIHRSISRLHGPNADSGYLDLALCHDAEFVSPAEALTAVLTLRELRNEGRVRYIGISGYPVGQLAALAEMVLKESGEPLDAVMSYANFTVQNTTLATDALGRIRAAGVGVVLNASPLGMGLLRKNGVPVGSMGDWHPAPAGLRAACAKAAEEVEALGENLARVAIRYAYEEWMKVAGEEGVGTKVPFGKRLDRLGEEGGEEQGKMRGVSVCGVSFLEELQDTLEVWNSILGAEEGRQEDAQRREGNMEVVEVVRRTLGKWVDYAWESPGEGFVWGGGGAGEVGNAGLDYRD
ncbi:Aldo/keto reductase family-domain-containing protein [Tirmania nivea]|nr:Aldo/keto reductase family-domain-containing protein [Tirmania nivea]